MTDWVRIKSGTDKYLQIFPDGTVKGVDNPGAGGKFQIEPTGPPSPAPPEPPPSQLVPITRGAANANFLYGPPGSYFVPACVSFDEDRFQRILTWNVDQGYTHLVINALEQDHWGADRGHPEWTVRHHRWWKNEASKKLAHARLTATRAAGLQPIVGLFEHTSLPLSLDDAVREAQASVNEFGDDISALIMCWETDERISDSRARHAFETGLLRRVDWKGIDVGIHYSHLKRLEGSGVDVNSEWRQAMERSPNPGRVFKFYQSRRDAPIDELKWETELLADVAHRTGNGLAIFEHSGEDGRIGQTYTLAEANRRAATCYEMARRRLPKDRTGSMNGFVVI